MSDSPVERENLTAALVRDYDDEALVEWIHALQDHGEAMEAEVERLTARVAGLEAALDDIIEHYNSHGNTGYYRPLDDAVEAARAALVAGEENDDA